MRRGRKTTLNLTLLGALLISAPAHGGAQDFIDKDEWIEAVGEFTTIGFTEFTNGTFVSDQYAAHGILFTDGNDIIVCCSKQTFPEDGAGLDGNGDISVVFDTPQLWIGVDFPGFLDIELYYQGKLFYTGIFGFGGVGNFGGILSDQPFDAAVLIDPANEAAIDDLHFGPPGPGNCPWDLDGNDVVGASDLLALLISWGPCKDCPADFDDNGSVGASDLLALLVNWGPCP